MMILSQTKFLPVKNVLADCAVEDARSLCSVGKVAGERDAAFELVDLTHERQQERTFAAADFAHKAAQISVLNLEIGSDHAWTTLDIIILLVLILILVLILCPSSQRAVLEVAVVRYLRCHCPSCTI